MSSSQSRMVESSPSLQDPLDQVKLFKLLFDMLKQKLSQKFRKRFRRIRNPRYSRAKLKKKKSQNQNYSD